MNSTLDPNQLATIIVRAITLLLLAVITVSGGCQMLEDYRKAEALKAGVSPVGISCVFDTQQDCQLAAAETKP